MLVVFSYLIAQGVCYLFLCEASFPKKMAFAYLEDLHSEFYDQYGRRVPTVTRPYSFIEFGETFCALVRSRNIVPVTQRTKSPTKLISCVHCSRHIHPENKEVVHRQQGQEELGQY